MPNPNHNPNLNVNPILTFSLKPSLNPQTAQKSSQNVHTVLILPMKCKHCSSVSAEHKQIAFNQINYLKMLQIYSTPDQADT